MLLSARRLRYVEVGETETNGGKKYYIQRTTSCHICKDGRFHSHPEEKGKRGRGRPKYFSDGLMPKALILMIIRRLYTAYSLLAFLEQETELTCLACDELLTQDGSNSLPRRTWDTTAGLGLPDRLPCLIGCLWSSFLVMLLQPWASAGGGGGSGQHTTARQRRCLASRRIVSRASCPHSTIDTEAHWSKSGYHGWWYGWKLAYFFARGTVLPSGFPLAAELTPANEADNKVAHDLLHDLPLEVRYILGDTAYETVEKVRRARKILNLDH